jgi:hypothetical protein
VKSILIGLLALAFSPDGSATQARQDGVRQPVQPTRPVVERPTRPRPTEEHETLNRIDSDVDAPPLVATTEEIERPEVDGPSCAFTRPLHRTIIRQCPDGRLHEELQDCQQTGSGDYPNCEIEEICQTDARQICVLALSED